MTPLRSAGWEPATGYPDEAASIDKEYCPCYCKDMSKVTSKLQVTVPKALAQRYGIRPGDDIRFEEAGEVIRVVPATAGQLLPRGATLTRASVCLTRRPPGSGRAKRAGACLVLATRGWTREELYERGHPVAD